MTTYNLQEGDPGQWVLNRGGAPVGMTDAKGNAQFFMTGGSNTITVGSNGQYPTIKDALDYISTQPQFTAYTPTNAPANVTGWTQGLSDATTDGFASINVKRDTWFSLAGDTYLYPLQVTNGFTAALISEVPRIEASLAATSKAITFYYPTYYTILLLDAEYAEAAYTLTANINVIFRSLSGSVWRCSSGTCALKQGVWKYGNLIIGDGVTLANTGSPFMTNNDNVTWNTPNCIRFRMLPGSRAYAQKSDMFSAGVKLGSLQLHGVSLDQRPTTSGAHFFNVRCGGDVIVRDVKALVAALEIDGVVTPDSRIFESCGGRRVIINGYDLTVNDPDGLLSLVKGFSSLETDSGPLFLSNINITLLYPSATSVSLYVSHQNAITGAPDVYLSDCHINAPGNTGTLKIYSAITGDTCKIHAARCTGGTIDTPSAGTKAVDNTFAL